eukprot:CAMPEP_0175993040 /NCGR_PEP_ID=MMETSP0108-20121206/53736_1 /TAXON_ID=195067 ORGANISM="Goniomonas pacifica, Strain CCMP1869" /NCGR_SAMPLE_ID=MMETSP0108 /ASSEMBLY_ACC=CAM_ASM_000204 /LENGTH=188 /DNA_ID=CAMNT_0017324769 /DNA_START=188 /DNA_END=755 /DNA_ORIENTATION=-
MAAQGAGLWSIEGDGTELPRTYGFGYQTMLGRLTSERILNESKAQLVFSGDDHDICSVQHHGGPVEHTVATLSWLQGNPWPSFAILAIDPTAAEVLPTCLVTHLSLPRTTSPTPPPLSTSNRCISHITACHSTHTCDEISRVVRSLIKAALLKDPTGSLIKAALLKHPTGRRKIHPSPSPFVVSRIND